MGATASIQRPELKYVSQKSALIQGYDIETINFVKNDKKFRGKKIRFILLDEIGKSRISEDITFDQIKESLSVL